MNMCYLHGEFQGSEGLELIGLNTTAASQFVMIHRPSSGNQNISF
jgi:hypothetical protein